MFSNDSPEMKSQPDLTRVTSVSLSTPTHQTKIHHPRTPQTSYQQVSGLGYDKMYDVNKSAKFDMLQPAGFSGYDYVDISDQNDDLNAYLQRVQCGEKDIYQFSDLAGEPQAMALTPHTLPCLDSPGHAEETSAVIDQPRSSSQDSAEEFYSAAPYEYYNGKIPFEIFALQNVYWFVQQSVNLLPMKPLGIIHKLRYVFLGSDRPPLPPCYMSFSAETPSPLKNRHTVIF